jgi:phage-related protein
MVTELKNIKFFAGAMDDLRAFPVTARKEAGYQLGRVQLGLEPKDWKPMDAVGPGVREIRIREADGAFRVIYVAKFAEAIYVLHCFQKKTQATSKADLDIAAKRYRLAKELSDEKAK